MRVVCQSVEEFTDNLRIEGKGHVYRDTVYLSRFVRKIDEGRSTINIQVSAVVDVDASSQYLLQAGEDCGTDYLAADEELKGTIEFERIKAKLVECCNELCLNVRPGIVDF